MWGLRLWSKMIAICYCRMLVVVQHMEYTLRCRWRRMFRQTWRFLRDGRQRCALCVGERKIHNDASFTSYNIIGM